ncbi:hypothetical protein TA5114_03377 [Cognatishimia activa]|uniref:Uncharacterized protein n=1 Tax=Cognatishimia activa TaxID=1715691 RepID=A0A0P1IVD0_9RHOB|nr:hypothetical protein TA5114_03377 [Cognatishimia activa]
MFADGQVFDATSRAFEFLKKTLESRHIAVFHAHPDWRAVVCGEVLNDRAIFWFGDQRLLHQNRNRAQFRDRSQLFRVLVIRRRNDQSVDVFVGNQVFQRISNIGIWYQFQAGFGHLCIGFKESCYFTAFNKS